MTVEYGDKVKVKITWDRLTCTVYSGVGNGSTHLVHNGGYTIECLTVLFSQHKIIK